MSPRNPVSLGMTRPHNPETAAMSHPELRNLVFLCLVLSASFFAWATWVASSGAWQAILYMATGALLMLAHEAAAGIRRP
ncbi:hypothetical protein SAMN05421595_2697 [Austwickia chelonae]|uniref:Uncharacterized protein n=1 Tax=Austwickia chelonae NBRC 105200 TaxID=1184607 RepID=K6VSV6_9MICO|nr:hypothetical protein [Austwickia chelonae]GAB78430.1 hypothetical protein AUCHE_09_00360 [Austwickia chelonae NBRC 105200]SEW39451.1 hypothetical protein SAMN05421595_2697 [Austwickia chelonae]